MNKEINFFYEYQEYIKEFAIYPEEYGLIYTSIGLINEIGEVLGVIKKYYRDNHLDISHLESELGDVLWYIAQLSTELGISINEITTLSINEYQQYHFFNNRDLVDFSLSLSFPIGRVSEILKSYIKSPDPDMIPFIIGDLGSMVCYITAICSFFNIKLQSVIDKNMNKLSGRKDRGTLSGNGEDR